MALYDQPGVAYDSPGVFYDEAVPGASTPTHMKKAKLNLGHSTPEQVANVGEAVTTAMTGNANFATPSPTLASITTQVEAVRAKKLQITGLESDITTARGELKNMTAELKTNLYKLRDYVQDESDGDETKIHSAGMQIVGEGTPVGQLPQVVNLRVSTTDAEGTLQCEWNPIYGALTYLIETATDPDGPWTMATATTRARLTLPGLTPGTKYWIRVRAVGAAGLGPYSDPACKIAA